MPASGSPRIRRVVPNDRWQLVLGFDEPGFRLFCASTAREDRGYAFLAYPRRLMNFTHDAAAVYWGGDGSLDAGYLYRNSRPISGGELRRQWLRIGYANQAPTSEHPDHHVYEVGLYPFDPEAPFSLAESIHGGFFDPGGTLTFSLEGLLRHPGWVGHFELSGCAWAAVVIERYVPDLERIRDELVREACRRAGSR